jgi:hypothetical protein
MQQLNTPSAPALPAPVVPIISIFFHTLFFLVGDFAPPNYPIIALLY